VLALLDLAQLQLAAGKPKAALKYLNTALSLAPNGRIVLRTAARFFVHVGQNDRAHDLIRRHPAAKLDPWLIASEISLADVAHRESTLLRAGQKLLQRQTIAPESATELAGALANEALSAGHLKQARDYLRQAMVRPTDNVIAQSVMDAGKMGIQLDDSMFASMRARSAEAQMLRAWGRIDDVASEAHALQWHAEEPFSSRPLQFLTSLQSIQGEYAKASMWVTRGLIADPKDEGLLRNQAFNLAAQGLLEKAELAIKRVRPLLPQPDDPYLTATQGLIEYRRGNHAAAAGLYRDAENAFVKSNQPDLAATCALYHARYAAESGAPDADQLLLEAKAKVERHPTIDAMLMLSKLDPETSSRPNEDNDQRRVIQWVFDAADNTLTRRTRVTNKRAPLLEFEPTRGGRTTAH